MTLYLLPNLLGEGGDPALSFPAGLGGIVTSLQGLIAESERGGRQFLRRFSIHLPIRLLNEHTHERDLVGLVEPLEKGEKWGLISDAGVPCLADPGAKVVALCREKGIAVEVIPGPSSIVIALMLSGFSSQSFLFHGYLPREQRDLVAKLRQMENEKITHLFIEAPYRNQKLLETLLKSLSSHTQVCVAWNLMLPGQSVRAQTVAKWKSGVLPQLDGCPAIFLISC